ncbi:MAG: hypothetical protein ACTSSG_01330 [Candidatus Heimdallarchaeaceae archaeon]
MSKEERKEFFEKQIEIEEKIIQAARESVKGVKNVLVKEMILSVAIDSEKHKNMLTALLARLTSPTPAIDEKVSEEIAKVIQEHIELEAEAIKQYKEFLDSLCCIDDKEKIIIKEIYEDELRHHSLLKFIYKTIVQKETLIEEEMWDHLWTDAFTHGTPGG